MRIRPYRPDDLVPVRQVLVACYRYGGTVGDCTAEQVDWLVDVRADHQTIAREADRQQWRVGLRGRAVVGVLALEGDEIQRLYVHPDHHGRGLGRMLFFDAVRIGRRSGHAALRLKAAISAVPFYEAMGMRVVEWQRPGASAMDGRMVPVLVADLASLAIPVAARPRWVSFWSLPPRFRSGGRHGAPPAFRSTEEVANRPAELRGR